MLSLWVSREGPAHRIVSHLHMQRKQRRHRIKNRKRMKSNPRYQLLRITRRKDELEKLHILCFAEEIIASRRANIKFRNSFFETSFSPFIFGSNLRFLNYLWDVLYGAVRGQYVTPSGLILSYLMWWRCNTNRKHRWRMDRQTDKGPF